MAFYCPGLGKNTTEDQCHECDVRFECDVYEILVEQYCERDE